MNPPISGMRQLAAEIRALAKMPDSLERRLFGGPALGKVMLEVLEQGGLAGEAHAGLRAVIRGIQAREPDLGAETYKEIGFQTCVHFAEMHHLATESPMEALVKLYGLIADAVEDSEVATEATFPQPNGQHREISKEANAILFVHNTLKSTGRLPTKKAIATHLGVDRRTLQNWKAFKVAYGRLQAQNRRPPPRGCKDRDGNLEAWRESGK
jgi:hypothetical protein